jgi:hypothetical protein
VKARKEHRSEAWNAKGQEDHMHDRHKLRSWKTCTAAVALLLGCAAGASLLALRPTESTPRLAGASIQASPNYQNQALLELAWGLPAARALEHRIDPQANPSSCGPSSLANLERSFGLVSSEDSVLDGSGKCWFGVCLGGLTLDELAELARTKTHHQVSVLRDLTYEQFRAELRHSNEPGRRYLINFHREPLFGEGHGHFSPIGGYLEERELVFVLDVNARYQPFLVDTHRLFEALDTVDSATGKKRGLLAFR